MSSSGGLLQRGLVLYAPGDTSGALHAFERYLDAHPRSAEGWLGMARTLFRVREMRGALAACERALTLAPKHPDALAMKDSVDAEVKRMRTSASLTGATSSDMGEFVAVLLEVVGALLMS